MKSKFTGRLLGLWVNGFLAGLFCVITLGFGAPWALCYMMKWVASNIYIDGRQLVFKGTGGSLLGHYLKWYILTVITCGIYGFWLYIKMIRWVVERTHFADAEEA